MNETTFSPLNRMIDDSKFLRNLIMNVFEVSYYMLKVPNEEVPLMYGLCKQHKPGEKMRKIVSNIKSPLVKIARWLVKELKQYGKFESFSVENTMEFVNRTKNIILENDDVLILISFDVTALFPSVPVSIAISSLKQHLQRKNVTREKLNVYIQTAEKCMAYNCFQFRNEFYHSKHGTSMGNPLSPLIVESFMSHFELKLKSLGVMPKIWLRYVDDVFAVVKTTEIQNLFNTINSQYETIKFTKEEENPITRSLNFLDLTVTRTLDHKLEFSVYRKATSTERYITSDSNCSQQHKLSAFHSMIHRLCNLPLSINNFKKEHDLILDEIYQF